MPLIIESNDLFSRLKMIESLRRFSVTKLLSSPALFLSLPPLSSVSLPVLAVLGKKSAKKCYRFSPLGLTTRAVNGVT